jgi:hypothetical protein
MQLDRVTITGADNSVSVLDLRALSEEYPFVEWGILTSLSSMDGPRFPSAKWIDELQWVSKGELALSLHVCGRWTREILTGLRSLPADFLFGFDRVQLNFHAERTQCEPSSFRQLLQYYGPRQYIFQIDGSGGNEHLQSLYGLDNEGGRPVDAVALFDISGGAGVLPVDGWPKPYLKKDNVTPADCGYAGGLGPDNLEAQLPLIATAAGDARIWIDMETRVRSNEDKQFDLAKVRRCLDICKPHITH